LLPDWIRGWPVHESPHVDSQLTADCEAFAENEIPL
jgi:hypothetical protein